MTKLSEILKSFRTATFKDTTIVFMGNNLYSVLGAVFFFILAHQAGPVVFGIFSIAIAVAITAVDLFDIAINNAIISFGSKSGWMAIALRNGLKRKLLLSVIFSVLLWIFIPAIIWILGKPLADSFQGNFLFYKNRVTGRKGILFGFRGRYFSVSYQIAGIFYSVEDRFISVGLGFMELYLGFIAINSYRFAESTGSD